MKVLVDTNIFLDVALERQPHLADSEQVLLFVEDNIITGYLSASSFTDLYYIIQKIRGKSWTMDFLQRVYGLCQMVSVDAHIIKKALDVQFRDFEDGVQYSVAYNNNIDVIVTRNPQDFPVSIPRILTPSELIKELS